MLGPPLGNSWLVVVVVLVLAGAEQGGGACWQENQANHGYSSVLSNLELTRTIAWSWANDQLLRNQIENILVVRPPQSQGNAFVREYLKQELSRLNWSVDEDQFVSTTLAGDQVSFTNILAAKWPASPRRLVLACHYDSKTTPEGFLGASDSAVPCAILLNLAATLNTYLEQQNNNNNVPELGLQLIFFDGEEQLYTNTVFGADGIYGSKHLAEKYAETPYWAEPGTWCQTQVARELDRMDILLLLDLIGGANPTFINSFSAVTGNFFVELDNIDRTLRSLACGDSQNCQLGPASSLFDPTQTGDSGTDDHTPFVDRGMRRVLHIIASPFPWFWHTLEDNINNMDFNTISRVNNVMRVFIVEYLRLSENSGGG